MSRAEEFIKEQSHIIENPTSVWISAYKARRAVEIAREEMIAEVCEWIDVNYVRYLDISAKGTLTANIRQLIGDLKQAMKDE